MAGHHKILYFKEALLFCERLDNATWNIGCTLNIVLVYYLQFQFILLWSNLIFVGALFVFKAPNQKHDSNYGNPMDGLRSHHPCIFPTLGELAVVSCGVGAKHRCHDGSAVGWLFRWSSHRPTTAAAICMTYDIWNMIICIYIYTLYSFIDNPSSPP